MYCQNCGKELRDGVKFCENCGTPVAAPAEQAAPPAEAPVEQPIEEPVAEVAEEVIEQPVEQPIEEPQLEIPAEPVVAPLVEAPKKEKKKKKWLLPVIIILVLAILGGTFAALYFCTDIFKKGDEEDNGKNVVAEEPKKEPEEVVCKNCEEVIEEGYYCKDCIDELKTEEENYPEVCVRCYIKYISENGWDAIEDVPALSDEEIFLIDKTGYFYCESCKSEKLCEECEGFLSEEDDDDICALCAQMSDEYVFCSYCLEVMEAEEAEDGVCEDCAEKMKYCEVCDAMLAMDDDDDVCYNCGEYVCFDCYEVLSEEEIAHEFVNSWGNNSYYCSDCDTGNYCTDCGRVLGKYDDDDVCYNCGEYVCFDCNEVLSNEEISHSYEDSWGDKYYYCENCDTGIYCSGCGKNIGADDDDDICSNCAEYACYLCGEVLEAEEISYSYTDEGGYDYYFCSECDTGNYCENCGYILWDDESTLCYSCQHEAE